MVDSTRVSNIVFDKLQSLLNFHYFLCKLMYFRSSKICTNFKTKIVCLDERNFEKSFKSNKWTHTSTFVDRTNFLQVFKIKLQRTSNSTWQNALYSLGVIHKPRGQNFDHFLPPTHIMWTSMDICPSGHLGTYPLPIFTSKFNFVVWLFACLSCKVLLRPIT